MIVALAQRLRDDPDFRDQVEALLHDDRSSTLSDRVKQLAALQRNRVTPCSALPLSAPQRLAIPEGIVGSAKSLKGGTFRRWLNAAIPRMIYEM